ncbi:MAG: hypothetical protein AAF739_05130 [Pseudomonadota bacterium]
MTVANIFIFFLGFLAACLLGLVAARMVWIRAVRVTRARIELDRPQTLRSFEARIAGAQARAAVSIRELERALERERQISAQARLMADQMSSSTNLAQAERDDTQSALVNLAETLDNTRARLREHEDALVRRNNDLGVARRELAEARQDAVMRDEDARRAEQEAESLRAELASQLGTDLSKEAASAAVKSGSASAIARQQIEQLRESVRQLRAEKTAAEASAARARLLLDARDDNEVLRAAREEFAIERRQFKAQIAELEEAIRKPRLVSDASSVDGDAQLARPIDGPTGQNDINGLRSSIDAMTATITAKAALETDGSGQINALIDKAAESGGDSALVTSLVEARERLRRRKASQLTSRNSPSDKKSPSSSASLSGKLGAQAVGLDEIAGAGTALAAKAAELSDTSNHDKTNTAARNTAGNRGAERRRQMPKASENDLNVV